MDENLKRLYDILKKSYTKSNLTTHCSPDQYQYRKNELLNALTEFVLYPYLISENEKFEKTENN